eukprot:768569-Hanusia_phi.AAC.2
MIVKSGSGHVSEAARRRKRKILRTQSLNGPRAPRRAAGAPEWGSGPEAARPSLVNNFESSAPG